MEIVSAIVQMLGGLAMFLYGIEIMGDGLKNSSGAALKRVSGPSPDIFLTGIFCPAVWAIRKSQKNI